MSPARSISATVAGLTLAVALVACGGASPAGTALLAGDAHSAAALSGVAVSPQNGTPDASPATQVSFLGPVGTSVTSVRVVGSRSGPHAGVLRAYATGTGESFLPARPFAAGERVSVSARVSAGASARTVTARFTIAHQAGVRQKEFPVNAGSPSEVQHYSTAPSLTPSSVHITTSARVGAAAGDLFLAPYQGDGTPGPMIAEQDGNLVWFHPLPAGEYPSNFQVQQYQGKPVLTWWQGRVLEVGFGVGEDEIFNTSYQHVATIRAGNGYSADLHEVRITPEGTAWIDAFDPIDMNLSPEHGRSDGILNDCVIQEIDIKTGLVMWEWHALAHIPLSASRSPAPTWKWPWDYVHLNSISLGSTGDVLLSARNTWTLYDVDIRSGAVRWRIGAQQSSFALGPGVPFYWQHDAEFQPGGLISVFDNGSDPPKERQSRGLLLRLDSGARRVTLLRQFVNPRATLLASSQGNTLSLPGGDWLLGYGGLPNFTEFDGAGSVLLDGTLGRNVQDFRTYLAPWSAQPPGAPAVIAARAGAGLSTSVSWNGATQVATWRVLAGASPSALSAVATAPRQGFQTTIAVSAAGPYVAVQALDPQGDVLGTSATVHA